MKKRLLIYLLSALAFLAAVFAVFYYLQTKKIRPLEIKAAEGEIAEINEQSIKLISPIDPTVPFDAGNPKNFKSFKINENTKIYRYGDQKKDEAQFAGEQEEFIKLVNDLKSRGKNVAGLEPPNWFVLEKADAGILKSGSKASVFITETDRNTEQAAATKVIVSRAGSDETDEVIRLMKPAAEFTGEIKKIGAGEISIMPEQAGTASASSAEQKIFKADDTVRVLRLKQKTEEQFLKEQAEFNERLSASGTAGTDLSAPSWFEETTASISDLKVGQIVRIRVVNDGERLIVSEIYTNTR